MEKRYDIHHHRINKDKSFIGIRNIIWGVNPLPAIIDYEYISVGIHPWYIPVDWEDQLLRLEETCLITNCIALGEIGLDRACKTDWDLQTQVFLKQLEIAERKKLPVIIHAVRTYADLLAIKKSIKPKMPWILHGYTGNEQSTKQLIKHDFLFSFGERLLRNKRLIRSLQLIPLSSLFLETDESLVPIKEIYDRVGEQLNLATSDLKRLIHKNFIRIFAPD